MRVALMVFWAMTTFTLAQVNSDECLAKLKRRITSFDREFDKNSEGDSICHTLGITASDARHALELFRAGVLYEDVKALARIVHFPITARVYDSLEVSAKPKKIRISGPRDFQLFRTQYLSSKHVAAIGCAQLGNIRAYGSGFMIANGMVWFQTALEFKGPKVTSINVRPMTNEQLGDFCSS